MYPTILTCFGFIQNQVLVSPHRQMTYLHIWDWSFEKKLHKNPYTATGSITENRNGATKIWTTTLTRKLWWSEQSTITDLKTSSSFITKAAILICPCGSDTFGVLVFNHTSDTLTCSCVKHCFLFQQLTSSHKRTGRE